MTCTETACGISPKNRSICRIGGGWASYAHMGRRPRKSATARRSKTLRTYPRTLGITWGQGVLTVTKTKGSLGCLTLRQKRRICTLLCGEAVKSGRALATPSCRRASPHASRVEHTLREVAKPDQGTGKNWGLSGMRRKPEAAKTSSCGSRRNYSKWAISERLGCGRLGPREAAGDTPRLLPIPHDRRQEIGGLAFGEVRPRL